MDIVEAVLLLIAIAGGVYAVLCLCMYAVEKAAGAREE